MPWDFMQHRKHLGGLFGGAHPGYDRGGHSPFRWWLSGLVVKILLAKSLGQKVNIYFPLSGTQTFPSKVLFFHP